MKYLDDRPVTIEERRTSEAWKKGGKEAEQLEREKLMFEKKEKNQIYLNSIKKNDAEVYILLFNNLFF